MSSTAARTSVNDLSSGEVSDSESYSVAAVTTGHQVGVSRKACIARRSFTSDHSSLSRIFPQVDSHQPVPVLCRTSALLHCSE